MQDSNNLKQTLESEHKQTDPKPIDKKGQNKILIPLAIILVLIFIGLLVYIIYTYLEYKNKTPLIIYQTESPIDSQEWCSNKGSVDYLETEVIPLDRNDYGYICLLDGNEEYYLQYYVPTVDIYINLEAGNSLGKEVFLDIINSIKLIDTTAIN